LAALPSATAPAIDDTHLPFDLPAVGHNKITVDFAGGNQSSNGGVLLVVCQRLSDAMPDRRTERIEHRMSEIVKARVAAIACGYEMRTIMTGCATIRR
jgi:hypothetical protein